jgi:hypothetical protein
MHKTMLAALIVGASALGIPAFAQVHPGVAAQVGAGANAAAAAPGAMRSADQAGMRAGQTLHRADQRARHVTHRTADRTGSTDNTSAHADAAGSMDGGMANTNAGANVDIGAGVNATNAAGNVGIPGQGVGDDVSDTAHSAIGATDRSAGSVGHAVRQTATGQSVGADAKVDAKAAAHGH